MKFTRWLQTLWHRPLSDKKIRRIAALAANPFAQPDVRCRQMERLLEDGSAPALEGVLQRFGALAQGHIADEEEKSWLVNALVEKGEVVLAPLRSYIRHNSKLTYALRAYRSIASAAASAEFFAQVLRGYGPTDHRSGPAKVQLINSLGECAPADRLVAWLAPSVSDISDEVVQATLRVLAQALPAGSLQPVDAAALMPQLLHRLAGPDTPPRVVRMVMALLAERGWPLPQELRQVPSAAAADFAIDDKGRVQARLSTA